MSDAAKEYAREVRRSSAAWAWLTCSKIRTLLHDAERAAEAIHEAEAKDDTAEVLKLQARLSDKIAQTFGNMKLDQPLRDASELVKMLEKK